MVTVHQWEGLARLSVPPIFFFFLNFECPKYLQFQVNFLCNLLKTYIRSNHRWSHTKCDMCIYKNMLLNLSQKAEQCTVPYWYAANVFQGYTKLHPWLTSPWCMITQGAVECSIPDFNFFVQTVMNLQGFKSDGNHDQFLYEEINMISTVRTISSWQPGGGTNISNGEGCAAEDFQNGGL